MSNQVSPRTVFLSKAPSFRDETRSEISKSPRKLLHANSREIPDASFLSPKKTATTPLAWPTHIQERTFASAMNTIRESENESIEKPIKGKKKGGEANKKDKNAEFQALTLSKKQLSDYSSLLMCFPEKIDSLSRNPENPYNFFNPFSDLVKSTTNKHDGQFLENILEENLMIKSARDGDKNIDKRDLMKKVLEFNKIQKTHYIKQTTAEKKSILLPLIKQVKEKSKYIPPVKVLPSRRLLDDASAVEVINEPRNASAIQTPAAVPNLKRGLNTSASAVVLSTNQTSQPSHSKKISMSLKAYEEKTDLVAPVYNFKAFRIFWAYNSPNDSTWKPEVREGHTFTTVGKQVILYGGLNANLLEDVTTYDPIKNTWERPRVFGDIPMSGRHGHTACEYKKGLVIFGGEHQFNPTLSIRECLNDTRMFLPEKNEWKHMRTINQINPRRHHAASVHDHSMWVYGGINNEAKFTKDLWALNLRNHTWDKIEAPGDKEAGIAFHTMCACYVDKSGYSLKDKEKTKTYEEGMYVFGGKNSEGKILNTLKVCSAEGKVYQWSYPITKGNAPTPRYNHTMLFYEPLGLLVVYGGRNDGLYESMNDICLNDIRILNLEQMVWLQATSHGDVPRVGRYRHAVAAYGTKMLVFGGVEFQQYSNEEVKSAEIHQGKVKNIINMDPDAEASNDRSRSRMESLPPVTKEKKKKHQIQIPATAVKSPKQIMSWLPIPMSKSLNESQDQISGIDNSGHHEKSTTLAPRF